MFHKVHGNVSFRQPTMKFMDENNSKVSNKSFADENIPVPQREFGKDITNFTNENMNPNSKKSFETKDNHGKNSVMDMKNVKILLI
jgi:hypothetical protein